MDGDIAKSEEGSDDGPRGAEVMESQYDIQCQLAKADGTATPIAPLLFPNSCEVNFDDSNLQTITEESENNDRHPQISLYLTFYQPCLSKITVEFEYTFSQNLKENIVFHQDFTKDLAIQTGFPFDVKWGLVK